MPQEFILETKALTKEFKGFVAVNNVDLKVRRGDIHALIGPNGAGKTTYFNLLTKFLPPTRGSIVFNGVDITSEKPAQTARRGIVRSFQISAVFPHMTVLENVMEGLVTVLKWPRERAVARALQLLDKVGLRHKAEAVPATLSGGQQQRVAIARALAPSPKVLLCDEPTSALDPELAQEVVAVLRQLASEGTTMLIATHDLRLAAQIAQQVIFLEAGEVVEAGSARQMFTTPKRARTFEYISTLTERLPESWSI